MTDPPFVMAWPIELCAGNAVRSRSPGIRPAHDSRREPPLRSCEGWPSCLRASSRTLRDPTRLSTRAPTDLVEANDVAPHLGRRCAAGARAAAGRALKESGGWLQGNRRKPRACERRIGHGAGVQASAALGSPWGSHFNGANDSVSASTWVFSATAWNPGSSAAPARQCCSWRSGCNRLAHCSAMAQERTRSLQP